MPDIAAARPVSGAPVASDWGGQVHDLIEGIQSGTVSVTYSSTQGTAPVVFPRPYATPPNIAESITSNVSQAAHGAVSTTGFTVLAQRTDGSGTSTTQTVAWVAVGVLA